MAGCIKNTQKSIILFVVYLLFVCFLFIFIFRGAEGGGEQGEGGCRRHGTISEATEWKAAIPALQAAIKQPLSAVLKSALHPPPHPSPTPANKKKLAHPRPPTPPPNLPEKKKKKRCRGGGRAVDFYLKQSPVAFQALIAVQ